MIPLFFTLSYFNSHAHMERDQAGNVRRNAVLHFNSHAHVERDGKNSIQARAIENISTHTLTWSVTLNYLFHLYANTFQLTRSRGA